MCNSFSLSQVHHLDLSMTLCSIFNTLDLRRVNNLSFLSLFVFKEHGYEFDKATLLQYNHMSFGGPPVTTHSVEEADELLRSNEQDSAIGN